MEKKHRHVAMYWMFIAQQNFKKRNFVVTADCIGLYFKSKAIISDVTNKLLQIKILNGHQVGEDQQKKISLKKYITVTDCKDAQQ